MSLSSSLANAMTGLNASSRSAQVVSSNIANALTEGYGKREIELSAQSLGRNGAGVNVIGVSRHADPTLIADRRIAQSEQGNAATLSNYFGKLEGILGIPGEPGSLGTVLTEFETSLVEASSRPDSTVRLQNVLTSAQNLTQKFHAISGDIQDLRAQADAEISTQVDFLNTNLRQIEYLNKQILSQGNTNPDVNALIDQRQVTIDAISDMVPIKVAPRDDETVALFTEGGAILVDGNAAQFDFTPTKTIVPEMTLASGALSGLSLNGQSINTEADRNAIKGGSLSALFEVRDDHLVSAQMEVDALARDLIERFSAPTLDPTSTGGLFTDQGLDFDTADEIAISERISVSPSVDPDMGGAIWRLRDGLGAVTQGEVGNAALVNGMLDALRQPQTIASGSFTSSSLQLGELATDITSLFGSKKQSAESALAFTTVTTEALRTQELSQGVDTDKEMQNLLLVERSYAANAKIIQSIDELFDLLLGL